MNIVLYTMDFEAITVIDLPMWAMDRLEKADLIRVPVMDLPQLAYAGPTDPVEPLRYREVVIKAIPIVWFGQRKFVLVTSDEEFAMLLKPDWLPGQRGEVQRIQRQVQDLSRFLLDALGRLG